jgi:hypothetical protein
MKSLINKTVSKIAISTTIAISTVGISTGIIPIETKIGKLEVSNVEVADAKAYNPSAQSFLPCQPIDRVCYVVFDVVWTWLPDRALNLCRNKYLYTDHVRRSFPPYSFACMRVAAPYERGNGRQG